MTDEQLKQFKEDIETKFQYKMKRDFLAGKLCRNCLSNADLLPGQCQKCYKQNEKQIKVLSGKSNKFGDGWHE